MRYEEAYDVNGVRLHPGDYVSVETYPRGTIRGFVNISDRALVVVGDAMVPALVVDTDEGRYNLPGPKSVRKLKRQPR
jgi:hypothetical protein